MTFKHAGPKNLRHFCVERASRKGPLCSGLRVFRTLRSSTSAVRPNQSVTGGYSTPHSMSRTSMTGPATKRATTRCSVHDGLGSCAMNRTYDRGCLANLNGTRSFARGFRRTARWPQESNVVGCFKPANPAPMSSQLGFSRSIRIVCKQAANYALQPTDLTPRRVLTHAAHHSARG